MFKFFKNLFTQKPISEPPVLKDDLLLDSKLNDDEVNLASLEDQINEAFAILNADIDSIKIEVDEVVR